MTPFHRTNLNLYAEDVEYMQQMFGRGWTEQVRDIIHQEVKAIKERDPVCNAKAAAAFQDYLDGK